MNPIDDSRRRASPQPTSVATFGIDPNAALLASLRPAPEQSLASLIGRLGHALSLDALAHSLQRSLPARVTSRKAAERGILGVIVGIGVAIGAVIYLGATSMSTRGALASNPALSARMGSAVPGPEVNPSMQHAGLARSSAKPPAKRDPIAAETRLAENAARDSFTTALEPQPSVASLEPRARQIAEPRSPKAKRAASKKKSKAAARRTAQKRSRARLASK